MLGAAFEYAFAHHQGQTDKAGQPYIAHLVRVGGAVLCCVAVLGCAVPPATLPQDQVLRAHFGVQSSDARPAEGCYINAPDGDVIREVGLGDVTAVVRGGIATSVMICTVQGVAYQSTDHRNLFDQGQETVVVWVERKIDDGVGVLNVLDLENVSPRGAIAHEDVLVDWVQFDRAV